MPHGHITRLVPEHGFGFIVDDGGLDWFFVRAGVRDDGFDRLQIDKRVRFAAEWTGHGPRAVDVHTEYAE